jgi:hypothetical protein
MKLYKYLPPERYDVLECGRIAVTSSTRFNDPFDCNPVIVADMSGLADQKEWERLKAVGQKMYQQEWAAIFRVLCLSEKWDIIPMWSYYAREHRGFVIEFDTEVAGWGSEVRKVNYSMERPEVVLPESKAKMEPATEFIAAHWTKAAAWCHEREWRLLFNLKKCMPLTTPDGEIVSLATFRKEAVTSVYLGARMNLRFKAFIRENVMGWGYGEANLAEISPDRQRFRLIAKPLQVNPEE